MNNNLTLAKRTPVNKNDVHRIMSSTSSWESRYREIMILGKKLANMPHELQTEKNKVLGCESNVWLQIYSENERYFFIIGSDAKIVKGLIVIILSQINGLTANEIKQVNIGETFKALNITGQLSASRTDGINAILNKIYEQI